MSLRRAAFSAGRWTAASLLVRAVLQIGQAAILARLLAPADFGLMATAGAVYAIVSLFVDFGLSNALIHFPTPSRPALSTLYWLNLGAAALVMLVFMAIAWPMAAVYGQPELLPIMTAMSLAMPLAAAGHQFCVMAEKELRFSVVALVELGATVCGFAAAVAVAVAGGGVYAFVATSLASATVSSVLAWALLSRGVRPGLEFDLALVKPYLRYGSYRLGDTLFNSIQSQADLLLGGAVAGATAMGFYTVPRNLTLQLANTVVNPIVSRVGLPVMAQVQHDKAALKSIYLQTLRMTSAVNFPFYVALALWSNDIVAILLGSQWHDSAAYLRVFAAWGLIRSTGNPVGSLVYATGRVRSAFLWNLAQLVVVPCILWIGVSKGGSYGLGLAMLCVQVVVFYPLFRTLVRPACGASFREYVGQLAPALAAAGIAGVAGLAVSSLFPHQMWGRVVVGGLLAAVTYVAASWVVNRPWIAAMVEVFAPVVHLGRRSRRPS